MALPSKRCDNVVDKVQIIYRSNTAPPSKTFRDEQLFSIKNGK
jgi:hypothetical protein